MPHIHTKPILTFGELITLTIRNREMTDIFRKEYKELSAEAKDDIFVFKSKAEALLHEFDSVNLREETDKRCMALAKTNLEQAIMWAVKAIT